MRLTYHHKKRRGIKDFFKVLGPGVITGAADNDPSGIVTYTHAGATTGFKALWLILITAPMLVVVEEMSARVGIVTKKGLSILIKENFGTKITVLSALILIICNVVTIGADIAGMAAILEIFTGLNWVWFIFPIAFVLGYFLISESYKTVSRYLLLLTPVFLAYIFAGLIANPNWGAVIKDTLVPQIDLSKEYLLVVMAILGTTISPYLIFWQTTEEIEEKKTVKDLKDEKIDVRSGMIYCNLISYFIILSAGALIFSRSTGGMTLSNMGDAAAALKTFGSNGSLLLFSIGILGSGLLAIPVLASSTAYALADTMHWKEGLDKSIFQARGFYFILILSLLFGASLAFLNIRPVDMLFYSQVLQGILTPILLFLLIRITSNSKIMGKYTNGIFSNTIGWITVTLMSFVSIVMFWQIIF
ncbi:MAG: divalent metal cation transporter [Candidatus Aenigmarchaeota archaeon]|nr:divalent metal cation transporter [Candidatus Aenigmarchaeota archaeon]